MNTGIGDAVDLSWKLAATLEGWGGDGLLDSYTSERQPVGARNVAEASGNLRRMLSVGAHPDIADDTPQGAATRAKVGREFTEMMRREWFTLGIHLGYRYEGSPICWPDGSPPPPDEARSYVADRAARTPRAARLARRRPLDARSVRPRLYAASVSARRRPRPRRCSMRRGRGRVPIEFVRRGRAAHCRALRAPIRPRAPRRPCRMARRPHAGRPAAPDRCGARGGGRSGRCRMAGTGKCR